MKLHKLAIFGMIMALAIVSGAVAQGFDGNRRGGGPGGERTPFWQQDGAADELGLTADQIDKLNDLRDAQQSQMQEMRNETKELRTAKQGIMRAETFDEAAFRKTVNDMANLAAEKVRARGDHILAIRDVLTDEQFAKVHAMMKANRQGRGGPDGKQGRGQGRGRNGNR